MRTSRLLPLLVVTLLLGLAAPAAAAGFRFTGSGWGHGVGMSQYGALEQARDGRSATDIIRHYYRGADVADRAGGLGPIHVGLSQDQTDVTARSVGGSMGVRFGSDDGPRFAVPAGTPVRIVVDTRENDCNLVIDGEQRAESASCWANLARGSGARLTLSNERVEYGRGLLRIRPRPSDATRFHVAAELPDLDTYLLGLREVPQTWPAAALQAQVIAARSYAAFDLLGSGGGFDAERCACHVYDSVLSQVYGGTTGETAAWRAAVSDTAGRVVYAPGESGTRDGIVQAVYSSSSGGRTEAIEDATPSFASPARSYFQSVDDPWSLRASNPYARWTNDVAESAIGRALGLDDVVAIRVTDRNESGSARRVVFSGTRDGRAVEVARSGGQLRRDLGLRSAYIASVFLPPFLDDDGNIHESAIAWIADRGITRGCNPPANDRFCPDDPVTRGQMAAFLTRALDLPPGDDRFRDTDDSIFEADIAALARAGITRGCNPPTNDRFCPDDPVTRGQMAAFLTRALDLPPGDDRFRDTDDSIFEADIAALARAGITRGCNPPTNDRFCPTDPVTRAQMATFLSRSRDRL